MTDQIPATATEARAVLDARIADRAFGERVFAGDVAARAELDALHAKIQAGGSDVVDMAIAGIVQGDVPDTGQKVMAETAAWMHGHGLSDGVIRQTLTNHEVTPEEFRAVQLWKSQKMASKEFVSRYLAGEPEEIKSMLLADVVLSSKIKTGASS